MVVYILSIDGDVWGAYDSMAKAESEQYRMESLMEEKGEQGEFYITIRHVE